MKKGPSKGDVPNRKAPQRKPKSPDRLTREQYARETLRQVHEDLADARRNGPKSNVPLLLREARSARAELDEALAASRESSGDPLDDLTDDELLAESIAGLREMPDHLREPLADELIALLGRGWFEARLSEASGLRLVPS